MINHKPSCPVARRVVLCFGAFLFLLWFSQALASAADHGTICFYSSESSVNNYRSLKEEFDSYLAGLGPYVFQPFSQKETFENFIKGRKNAVFVLSSWHYKNLKERFAMEPLLVGQLQDRTTQRRVLCADKAIPRIELLKGEKIAAAGAEDYTRNVLREMWGTEPSNFVSSVSVLMVPKDIDALLAVSFKMARAAITTEASLASLARINPKQHAQLHVLASSQDTLLPIVATPAQGDRQVETLVRILEEMGGKPAGQRLVKMLGFDRLQRLAAAEKNLLAQ